MEIEREERNGSGYQEKQEFITGLYYEYERLMFATARRYIDDRTEQEDVGQESLIVELTGNQSKLEGFLNLVQGYEILELARTGVTGLSRGVHDVRYLD